MCALVVCVLSCVLLLLLDVDILLFCFVLLVVVLLRVFVLHGSFVMVLFCACCVC